MCKYLSKSEVYTLYIYIYIYGICQMLKSNPKRREGERERLLCFDVHSKRSVQKWNEITCPVPLSFRPLLHFTSGRVCVLCQSPLVPIVWRAHETCELPSTQLNSTYCTVQFTCAVIQHCCTINSFMAHNVTLTSYLLCSTAQEFKKGTQSFSYFLAIPQVTM